jgi:hypothetical protein
MLQQVAHNCDLMGQQTGKTMLLKVRSLKLIYFPEKSVWHCFETSDLGKWKEYCRVNLPIIKLFVLQD